MYFYGTLASDDVAPVLLFFLKNFGILGIYDFTFFLSVSFVFLVFLPNWLASRLGRAGQAGRGEPVR